MKEINNLVFSGGGIRGLAFIGIIKKLQEFVKKRKNLELQDNFDIESCKIPLVNIKNICAVSIGSVISLMYLIGYSYIEMLEIVLIKKFDKLKDIKIIDFIDKFGLDTGNNIIGWLKELMENKNIDGNITLMELHKKTNVNFQIMATNLNKYTLKNFNYIDTPDIKVLDAIRMSISIPLVFIPKEYEKEIYVDGCLINNYPIEVFDDNLENTLGFKLVTHGETEVDFVNQDIYDIQGYMYNIFNCYSIQKEKWITRNEKYKVCTVFIHTKELSNSLNFNLTPLQRNKLIQIGYNVINQYFN